MFLALKEIKKDKGRFLLIISIVVLISYLVFFLTGLAYGLARDNMTAVENWQAEKIVLKSGTNSNILSSMIDENSVEDFNNEEISPINIGRSVAYINGKKSDSATLDLVLMGLKRDSKAYPEVIEGKLPSKETEILASKTLKDEEGVQIGDVLVMSMNDREFTVTGFTKESKFNVSSVIYTDLEVASASMMAFIPEGEDIDGMSQATPGMPKRISGILIHNDSSITTNDKYDVFSTADFIQNLPGYLAQVLTFGLMIGFLILISTIVLGVFMFIITMQKKQTFGIMKVQGIANDYIAKSVIIQTLIVSFVGVLIGLVLTYVSEVFLPYTVPFKSNAFFYAGIAIAILLISLLGAIFSVKGVSQVDPLEVLE